MLNAAIKRNQANVGSISIIWIGFVYFGLLLFGNVSRRSGSKNEKICRRNTSIVCFEREVGPGVRLLLRDIKFFVLFVGNEYVTYVFTFVLRWILERRTDRSVRRAQNSLLERDGSC